MSFVERRAAQLAAEIWRRPLPPLLPEPSMSMLNVNVSRYGADAVARVSVTHDDGKARVLLEVDTGERTTAILRIRPQDVATLGDALGAAARALYAESETFPAKHSRR